MDYLLSALSILAVATVAIFGVRGCTDVFVEVQKTRQLEIERGID